MGRARDESGRYKPKYTDEDVLRAFESAPVPVLTAPEVAEMLGCSRVAARNRLEELAEEGRLYRKEVGARAVVYIRLDQGSGRLSGYSQWKQSLWEG